MKKIIVIATAIIVALPLMARGDHSDLDNYPKEAVSQAEKEGLILMRQEEKLARDVYARLYDIWKLKTFANISKSEQQHMDAVKELLERYSIADPVKSDTRGVYNDPKMTKLYKDLTAQGAKSLKDALIVGATIEDLDIHDLDKLLNESDNKDIDFVYTNLKKGSENHIRSFTRQLEREGATYKPRYISQKQYDEILSSSTNRGNGENQIARNKRNSQQTSRQGYGAGPGQNRRVDQ